MKETVSITCSFGDTINGLLDRQETKIKGIGRDFRCG